MNKLTLLAVDDDIASVELVKIFLEDFALLKVFTATSVSKAWEIVVQVKPDLLISDIAMPREDGFVLINKIRSNSNSKISKTLAIALTAYADTQTKDLALHCGFKKVLVKPIDLDDLVETINVMTENSNFHSHFLHLKT